MATVRISTADEPTGTKITVDGHLSGDAIEQVQSCCNQAFSKPTPVRLHLRDVAVIDERGRTLLRNLAAKGVELSANGIYSSYIVDEIRFQELGRRRSR